MAQRNAPTPARIKTTAIQSSSTLPVRIRSRPTVVLPIISFTGKTFKSIGTNANTQKRIAHWRDNF